MYMYISQLTLKTGTHHELSFIALQAVHALHFSFLVTGQAGRLSFWVSVHIVLTGIPWCVV